MSSPESTQTDLAAFDDRLLAEAQAFEAQRKKIAALFDERARIAKFDVAKWRETLPLQLRVLIITPCDDGHKREYWESIRALERRRDPAGHIYDVITPHGDSLIPRARNNYHHIWRSMPYDVIGWLDSDLDFRPEDVWKLVSNRLPIVAGRYPIKEKTLRWCVNAIPGEVADPNTGLQKVACAGTGALFIHRCVDEAMMKMAPMWPHWPVLYKCDNETSVTKYHFYHHGVIDDPKEFGHTPRDMSEDWSFCYFARKLGFDIVMDHNATFLHIGQISYPLEARRLTREEVEAQKINQPDGTQTDMAKKEAV